MSLNWLISIYVYPVIHALLMSWVTLIKQLSDDWDYCTFTGVRISLFLFLSRVGASHRYIGTMLYLYAWPTTSRWLWRNDGYGSNIYSYIREPTITPNSLLLLRNSCRFQWSLCYSIFSFMCMFCRPLFVFFLLAIVLSVLWFTDSDYPLVIFKLFLSFSCKEHDILKPRGIHMRPFPKQNCVFNSPHTTSVRHFSGVYITAENTGFYFHRTIVMTFCVSFHLNHWLGRTL